MKISNSSMKLLYKLIECPVMNNAMVDSVVGDKAVDTVRELLDVGMVEIHSGSNAICLTEIGVKFFETKLPPPSNPEEQSDYPDLNDKVYEPGTLGSFLQIKQHQQKRVASPQLKPIENPKTFKTEVAAQPLVQRTSSIDKPTLEEFIQLIQGKSIEEARRLFASLYIEDTTERLAFRQAGLFTHWANYMAGYFLKLEGHKSFNTKQIKGVLQLILGDKYDAPGFQMSGLLTADVAYTSNHHKGFPILERVGHGRYSFLGYKEGLRRQKNL